MKKKAYYNNSELAEMILTGSVEEVLEVLDRQFKRGQNKSLFQSTKLRYAKYWCEIDARILEKCLDIMNVYELSRANLSNNTIKYLFDKLDKNQLVRNKNGLLDDLDFVEKVKDKLNFGMISRNRNLSPDFIERFKEYIDWNAYIRNYDCDFKILLKYRGYFDEEYVLSNFCSYKESVDIEDIKLLVGNVVENVEALIHNKDLCSLEILNYYLPMIREEERLVYEIITLSDSGRLYSQFIEENYETLPIDKDILFNKYNSNGELYYNSMSKRLVELFYEPTERPELARDILSRKYCRYSTDFLKKFEPVIDSVSFAEKICYFENVGFSTIKKCLDVFKKSGRKTSRIVSILRANNKIIVANKENAKKAIKLLDFSLYEWKKFQLAIAENEACKFRKTEKMSVEDILDIFNTYYDLNNIDTETRLKYTHDYFMRACNIETKEDVENFKNFIESYTVNTKRFPITLFASHRAYNLKKDIDKEFIFKFLIDGYHFDGVYFLFASYEITLDDIKSLLDKNLSNDVKDTIFDKTVESYPVNQNLLESFISEGFLRKRSTSSHDLYNIARIPLKTKMNKKYLNFILENFNFTNETNYLLELLMNSWISSDDILKTDILEIIGDNKHIRASFLTNSEKYTLRKEYSKEEFENILKSKFNFDENGNLKGYTYLPSNRKHLEFIDESKLLSEDHCANYDVSDERQYNNYPNNCDWAVSVNINDIDYMVEKRYDYVLMTRKLRNLNVITKE
jgi:hypothetical protein